MQIWNGTNLHLKKREPSTFKKWLMEKLTTVEKKTALGHAFVEWPLSHQNYLHDKQHMHTDSLNRDAFGTTLSTTPVLIWMHCVPMRFTTCSCICCVCTEIVTKWRNVVPVMLTCCTTMSIWFMPGSKLNRINFTIRATYQRETDVQTYHWCQSSSETRNLPKLLHTSALRTLSQRTNMKITNSVLWKKNNNRHVRFIENKSNVDTIVTTNSGCFGSAERVSSCGKRSRPCCTWEQWKNARVIMFLISNVLTQRGKYHYTEKCKWTNGKKKTLTSNVARMNEQSWLWFWSCTVASACVYPCIWFGLFLSWSIIDNIRLEETIVQPINAIPSDSAIMTKRTMPCARKCISLLVRCMNVFDSRIRIRAIVYGTVNFPQKRRTWLWTKHMSVAISCTSRNTHSETRNQEWCRRRFQEHGLAMVTCVPEICELHVFSNSTRIVLVRKKLASRLSARHLFLLSSCLIWLVWFVELVPSTPGFPRSWLVTVLRSSWPSYAHEDTKIPARTYPTLSNFSEPSRIFRLGKCSWTCVHVARRLPSNVQQRFASATTICACANVSNVQDHVSVPHTAMLKMLMLLFHWFLCQKRKNWKKNSNFKHQQKRPSKLWERNNNSQTCRWNVERHDFIKTLLEKTDLNSRQRQCSKKRAWMKINSMTRTFLTHRNTGNTCRCCGIRWEYYIERIPLFLIISYTTWYRRTTKNAMWVHSTLPWQKIQHQNQQHSCLHRSCWAEPRTFHLNQSKPMTSWRRDPLVPSAPLMPANGSIILGKSNSWPQSTLPPQSVCFHTSQTTWPQTPFMIPRHACNHTNQTTCSRMHRPFPSSAQQYATAKISGTFIRGHNASHKRGFQKLAPSGTHTNNANLNTKTAVIDNHPPHVPFHLPTPVADWPL